LKLSSNPIAPWLFLLLAASGLSACDDAGGEALPEPEATEPEAPEPEAPQPEVAVADCTPSAQDWTEISAHLTTLCSECHGETPQFGAATTLLDYSALLAGAEGERLVDQLAGRLGDGTMPPAAKPQPDSMVRKIVLDWATCEDTDIIMPNPGGIGADRPILDAPDDPPAGTDFFDLRAPDFEVATDWANRYQCFTFEVPTTETRFIKRIDTLIGDARVLHHTILIPGGGRDAGENGPCASDNPLNLIYGWAPGQGALHFEEGGMRLEPGSKLTVQIHYNNGARHSDVRDNSGVRIYHGPVEGPEISMLAFGPLDFEIPDGQISEITGYCRLPQDTRIIASFPHMHEVGAGFEQVVIRNGADEADAASIITLDGWNFDAQYIYETPVDLATGDLVRTTCRFRNDTGQMVTSGPNTEDEMCFNFAYVTPPLPNNYCNSGAPADPVPLYEPGECAPDDADAISVPQVSARLVIGQPDTPEGGALTDGTWVLTGGRLFLPSTMLGPITVDTESTSITGQGLLRLDGETFILDSQIALHLVTSLTDFDETIAISLAADWANADADASQLALTPTCGDDSLVDSVRYTVDGQRLTFQLGVDIGPAVLTVELDFDSVE
jgi:hypothetical protein